MTGFIAMDRGAMDHPLLKDGERFRAWFWLLSKACWKATPFDINGKVLMLERGQLCVSRSQLAEAWKWSPSAVERFLTRLETEQMIGRATGQGRTIITICNYAKYQDFEEQTGQAAEQQTGQRSDSDRTAKEQGNKETKENSISDASAPPVSEYAFSGSVIRLKRCDFERWQESYPAIDLRAALQSRDDWLSGEAEASRKRWFNSTSSWLAKKQQQAADAEKASPEDVFLGPC